MPTHPSRRSSDVRPIYRGTGGKRVRAGRLRASDLPVIAGALGIDVDTLVELAREKTARTRN